MAIVELRDLVKSYGSHRAVDEVSLTVGHGEFVALVGPSGCGKTTTLNLVAGLLELTSGEIRIGERLVNTLDPKDRDVAMVFQNYALYPNKTVRRNLAFPLQMRKAGRAEIERRVAEAARALAIEPLLERYPRQLSGGQQQRVALGRAMVRDPAVFLMDEPLSNLDAKLRVQMRTELKRFHQDQGATIIYVTHDQLEAMTMADRMAVMSGGKLQQYDSPANVFASPANVFVAGFVGSPAMNLLPAELTGAGLRGSSGWVLPLDDAARRRATRATSASVVAGIRHSAVTLQQAEAPGTIAGRIYTTEPTGDLTYAYVNLGGDTLVVSVPPAVTLAPDQPVWLGMPADQLHLFDGVTEQALPL